MGTKWGLMLALKKKKKTKTVPIDNISDLLSLST